MVSEHHWHVGEKYSLVEKETLVLFKKWFVFACQPLTKKYGACIRACKEIYKLIVKNIMCVALYSNPLILENTLRCVSMREKKDRPWTWTTLFGLSRNSVCAHARAHTHIYIYILQKNCTNICPLGPLNKCVLTNWGARRKYLQHNGLPFLNMFYMKMLLCLRVAFS
jgi:hypothetical protein